mmetsp:Transcript_47815/g.149933  ORF Transcript_47815/g.149933 Transcript_47815/m.149933 type:complete len:206 (-) Transcript_47815:1976-2593(-)
MQLPPSGKPQAPGPRSPSLFASRSWLPGRHPGEGRLTWDTASHLDLGQDVPLMLLCDPLADLSLQRVLLLYIVDFSHHTLLLLHSELSFSPVLLDSLLQLFTTRLKHLLHQLLACRPLFLPHLLAFAPGLLLLCLSDRLACRLIHGFFLHKFNELRLVLPGLLTQLRLVLQLGLLCTPFFVQHGIKQFQVFFLLASDFCVLLSSQ